jgi:hypothetical protein
MDLWFATWRCGGSILTPDRGQAGMACPEHPQADRLGAPERLLDVVVADLPQPPGLSHDPLICPACGTWHDHPNGRGRSLVGHVTSHLVPSPELAADLERQRAAAAVSA